MLTKLLKQAHDRLNPAGALKSLCSSAGTATPATVTTTAQPNAAQPGAAQSPVNQPNAAQPVVVQAPAVTTNTTLPKRTVRLIMVTAANNNKFYDLRENDNDTFEVRYGRVGSTASTATYPMALWDRKIREKTAKGYVDQTHLFAENSSATSADSIAEPAVRGLMNRLLELANLSIRHNYVVSARQVTRKQVDTAQSVLDALVAMLVPGLDLAAYNARLLNLFGMIPRRMSRVNDHLLSQLPASVDDWQAIRDHLANEQSTLDVMRGQVELTPAKTDVDEPQPTLLDTLKLQVEPVTDRRTITLIRRLMGPDANKFDAAFSVGQAQTEVDFQQYVAQQTNPKTQLLWHGSRSENWLSILRSGLVLRPANAIITGKMFGYGIYFADQFSKSLNYTSLHGSTWAGGRQREAYLALYEVHVGNQLEITRHEASHMSLSADGLRRIDPTYHSVFARRGESLQKNEYIVYHPAQCTIRYMVRIKL